MPREKRADTAVVITATGHLMEEVGRQVRAARQQRHLTQQALSRLVGVSRVTISKIENGHHKKVNPHYLEAIAGVLKLKSPFVTINQPPPPIVDSLPGAKPAREVSQIIERLYRLPLADQQRVSRLVEFVLIWYEGEADRVAVKGGQ